MIDREVQSWEKLQCHLDSELESIRAFVHEYRPVFTPELTLRMQACGAGSLAVASALDKIDYLTKRLMNTGLDRSLNGMLGHNYFLTGGHVIVEAEKDDETFIVDAAYSQFLRPFGVHDMLSELGDKNTDFYPREEIISFPSGQTEQVTDWLADTVEWFWRTHGSSERFMELRECYPRFGFINDMPRADLKSFFMTVYDRTAYEVAPAQQAINPSRV